MALVAVLGGLCLICSAAIAATVPGRTSQHGVVRATIGKHDHLAGLVIELTHCTDQRHRKIWPGFVAPFAHPQDASGNVGDSYDITGRDAATGLRFRQRASFKARLIGNTFKGWAAVTQTLIGNGVVCRSPRVTFTVHL